MTIFTQNRHLDASTFDIKQVLKDIQKENFK